MPVTGVSPKRVKSRRQSKKKKEEKEKMASFASSATTGDARKHAWTNYFSLNTTKLRLGSFSGPSHNATIKLYICSSPNLISDKSTLQSWDIEQKGSMLRPKTT